MKLQFASGKGPNLFKRDSDGRVRVWRMEWDADRKYRSVSGLIDGKQTENEWTLPVPKRQKTVKLQGEFEILAKYKHQLDREYHETQESIDTAKLIEPMLAKPFTKFPGAGFQQPKLDGIRCIASSAGLFSRQGQPILAVPHIQESCKLLFVSHPELILDGELYNHDLHDDFGEIVSIVRKQNLTAKDLKTSKDIMQYHVYDIVDSQKTFSQRLDALRALNLPECIKLVETLDCNSKASADAQYAKFVESGYEGSIYRLDKPYDTGKRSSSLLKRKEFLTSEFAIVAIEQGSGNWTGAAKRMTLRKEDGTTFGAGIRGNYAAGSKLLKAVLNDKSVATVRYFQLSAHGIPRFPVVIDVHINGRQD